MDISCKINVAEAERALTEKPMLSTSAERFLILNEIKDIRNYWVHKGYIEFLYGSQQGYQRRLENQYRELVKDCNRISPLAKQLEDIRIEMMIHYGRS